MLVDLDAWRSRGIADRAFRYVGELGSRVDFLHQEALNAILISRSSCPRGTAAGRSAQRRSRG